MVFVSTFRVHIAAAIFAILTSLAAFAPRSAGAADVLGGYNPVALTPELKHLLVTSLETEKRYRPSVARRICVNDVESVELQVRAGTSYAFSMSGCDVSATLKAQLPVATKSAISKQLGACSEEMKVSCVPVHGVVTVVEKEPQRSDAPRMIEVASIILQQ